MKIKTMRLDGVLIDKEDQGLSPKVRRYRRVTNTFVHFISILQQYSEKIFFYVLRAKRVLYNNN